MSTTLLNEYGMVWYDMVLDRGTVATYGPSRGKGVRITSVGWPWPMTQSQSMSWVDHDYWRIMMSSRLLPSLLCNDVQSGILDMAYSVNFSIVYILYIQ